MKKHFVRSLIVFALVLGVTLPALADTIRLKDGSVIRGQIVSFKNEQFTILVGSGARGRKSRMTIYMEDVDSIEFDSAGNTSGPNDESSSSNTQPMYQPPSNTQSANNQSTYQPPPSNNTQPTSSRSNSPAQPNTSSNSQPAFFQVNTRVKADNTGNGWTNTGLVVQRGQRLKITATGKVSLGRDPRLGGQISSTADGIIREDKDKLMRNQRTGGLIAVIGDDNDDFVFIGSNHDFVVQRDGILFLGVNEGNLSDNSGTFDVVIEAEAMSAGPRR
jgi:hypothetical protein